MCVQVNTFSFADYTREHDNIYTQIVVYLDIHHPLPDSQWGFRPGHSTVSALLSTVNNWLEIMESGKEICSVFFYTRKPLTVCCMVLL